MKKLTSIALAAAMTASLTVSAWAENNTHLGVVEDVTTGNSIIHLQPFPFTAVETESIIDSLSESIVQLVFSVEVDGGDIVTIGYLAGSTGFDEDDMNEKVNNMVVAINEMIQSNPKTKGNVWIDINDLVLSSVYVAMEPNEVYASLTENHVDVNNVIDTLGTKDGVNANDSITSVATNTIDGSYHFTKVVGKVVQIYWHDQTTGVSTYCQNDIAHPHSGDGNNRYRSGAGYKWFPNNVDVQFYTATPKTGQNRTKLSYKYTQAQLDNLNLDSNEAIELEVVFYNYKNASSISNRGCAFQTHLSNEGTAWSTNQPNAYLDTTASDISNEVSFCVGVDDTTALKANTTYYWMIDGAAGDKSKNYANDGRFRVTAQRSYRAYGSGKWGVFSEEHEAILKLGVPQGSIWVPANNSAWKLAASGTPWKFVSGSSPVQ